MKLITSSNAVSEDLDHKVGDFQRTPFSNEPTFVIAEKWIEFRATLNDRKMNLL